MRTAIIVGVVIGVLAMLALVNILWNRWMKRSAKAGTQTGSRSSAVDSEANNTSQVEDKQLEIGVVQEAPPVYKKEPMEDERRLAIAESDERRPTAGQSV